MNFDSFLQLVTKIKNLPLPGEDSQHKMSPPYRLKLIEQQRQAMKEAKKAGVMALFYPDMQYNTKMVLILRKSYKGVHSAQVAFPGGKVEPEDQSLQYTAIRETEEEIGVPSTHIEIVKPLTKMYIPPSNYNIYPFLGITPQTPAFKKQVEEVEELIEIGLNHFLDDSNVVESIVPTSYDVNVRVPAFKLNGHIVWGATAMVLSELKDLLKQVL